MSFASAAIKPAKTVSGSEGARHPKRAVKEVMRPCKSIITTGLRM